MNTKPKINTLSILMLLLFFVISARATVADKSLLSKQTNIIGNGSISGHVTVSRSDLSNLGSYNYQQVDVLLLDNCTGGSVIARMVTDVKGKFKFDSLDLGSYLVTIDDKGSMIPLQPTDICVTIDAQASNTDLLIEYRMTDCLEADFAASTPYTAPLLCDISILDNTCSRPEPVQFGNEPITNVCDTLIGYYSSWFQIQGGMGDYNIDIFPFFDDPDYLGKGFLFSLFDYSPRLDGTDAPIYCSEGCNTDMMTISSDVFIPGQTYYLMVSTCDNEEGSFRAKIRGDYSPFTYPEIDTIKVLDACKDSLYSLSNLYTFKVFPNDGSSFTNQVNNDYNWALTSPENYISKFLTNTDSLQLFFTIPGRYSLCLERIANSCASTDAFCIDFEVFNSSKVSDLGSFYLCKDDFPWDVTSPDFYGNYPSVGGDPVWKDGSIDYSDFVANNGRFKHTVLSDCGTDLIQNFTIQLLVIGSSCDDKNPLTTDDRVDDKCVCKGSLINETVDTKPEIYQVFPNPVTHDLYINDPSTSINDFKIYDVLGVAVNLHFETLSLGLQLDVSSLKPGVYTIHIAQKSSLRVIPDSIFRFVKL